MHKFRVSFLSGLLIILFASVAAFAQTGTIRGTIRSEVNNEPIPNVSVQITQLRRNVLTDASGAYEFTNLPPGRYTVVAHIEGFSDRTQSVQLTAGATAGVDLVLSLTALREEVTVTASGTQESVFDTFQTVTAVGSTRIREQANTGIGEILEREAGIGKRSFGPGTSRPIIRGFDGDRVLVLQDGARNGSLGSQSGDHGEPIDTLNLERIEVIKGPATLLYGSNAIGGVVNAITGDENYPHQGFRGYFTGLGATNNRQGGLSGGLEAGFNRLLFTANGNFLREGDYRTPLGRIPNSASRAFGGASSLGYYGNKGFLNGSFSMDRRRYGVPYAPLFENGSLLSGDCHHDHDHDGARADEEAGSCEYNVFAIAGAFRNTLPPVPDEEIDIRMRRYNYRLRGGFRNLNSFIPQGNFFIDFADYRHREIETEDGVDEVATTFDNDVLSYRAMFQQANYKLLSGRFGFEGFRRSYLTEGAEQLVEGRVRQNNFAAFGLQELNFNRVALQFGGRVETNRYRPTSPDYLNRDFTGVSGAFGARFHLWEGSSLVANFTSSYRAPALEELYNEGPHIGTVSFEIGNQLLERERSNGIEFSFRQNLRRVRINGSIFYYNIKDFVYLAPQDADGDGSIDVEDGLPVAAYLQDDSRFRGADLTVDVDINKYIGAFASIDTVDARVRDIDLPLPRITPTRARLGVDFRYKGLSVRPEGVFVAEKRADDVYPLETPTEGYRLFNINSSYTFARQRYAHIFTLSGTNLTDKLYRNHLSYIKNLAPEMGRNLRFSYTVRFF
jgi:iron complex outermembrane recepter protein